MKDKKGVFPFQGNSCIQTLDLTDNNMGPKGAEYIADALKENTFITNLVSFHFYQLYRSKCVGPSVRRSVLFCLHYSTFIALWLFPCYFSVINGPISVFKPVQFTQDPYSVTSLQGAISWQRVVVSYEL